MILAELKKHYIQERVKQVDKDFFLAEEEMASEKDLELILGTLKAKQQDPIVLDNPHNSILLYITGLTNTFDFERARSDSIGGSPPDIDIDHGALERNLAIDWVRNHWGEDNVAKISTALVFKPKSLLDGYFRVITPKPEVDDSGKVTNENKIKYLQQLKSEIRKKIPDALFGKEATLEEIINGNEEKGFLPHPELLKDKKYEEFIEVARKLEGAVRTMGTHPAGIVISNNPINDTLPVLTRNEKKAGSSQDIRKPYTQFDMEETEAIGLIKFDLLAIDNGSIIKRTCELIKTNHGIDIDPDHIPDGDKKAYTMMHLGILTGLFQVETSDSIKKLVQEIKPININETSDISAIHRPGPLSAGLDGIYITNKNNGYAPNDLPEPIAEILKDSHYTLLYQEQLMQICHKVAGFSLVESDTIRKALGKKKKELLEQYESRFIQGCISFGLTQIYSQELWQTLIGFADYCLTADTLIKTPFGTISIQEIVENKLEIPVCSIDINQDPVVVGVNQWYSRGNKQTYTYKLEDGSSITCTEDHQFLCENGEWRAINEIFERNLELKT